MSGHRTRGGGGCSNPALPLSSCVTVPKLLSPRLHLWSGADTTGLAGLNMLLTLTLSAWGAPPAPESLAPPGFPGVPRGSRARLPLGSQGLPAEGVVLQAPCPPQRQDTPSPVHRPPSAVRPPHTNSREGEKDPRCWTDAVTPASLPTAARGTCFAAFHITVVETEAQKGWPRSRTRKETAPPHARGTLPSSMLSAHTSPRPVAPQAVTQEPRVPLAKSSQAEGSGGRPSPELWPPGTQPHLPLC